MDKNVKLGDLLSTYDNMDSKKILGERLREAVNVGDIGVVKELLNLGADVNARHFRNGWTALHWACKNGYADIVALLLKNGADKNIKSDFGETPRFVCSSPQILKLLDTPVDAQLTINDATMHNAILKYSRNDLVQRNIDSGIHKVGSNGVYTDELVLKIRVADALDPDFIEIELPQNDLTYWTLVEVCCQELDIDCNQIVKLRKLPNTKLRRDKDIQRLQNFQEIEVVTNSVNTHKYMQNTNSAPNNIPSVPANGYQSISKKDQTILY
ncbi:ankyrin repeat domain-containing protein 40 [Augochlora pura]